jgi:hypothetical protein
MTFALRLTLLTLFALLIGANVSLRPAASASQLPATTPEDLQFNGPVNVALQDGDMLFVGGDFDYIGGAPAAAVAAFKRSDGSHMENFPEVAGTVYAISPDGAGGWFVGGSFSSIGGHPSAHLAHLNADLSVTTAWYSYVDDDVYSLRLDGDRLLVGGYFDAIGGQPRQGAAMFNRITRELLPWAPAVPLEETGIVAHVASDRVFAVNDDGLVVLDGTSGALIVSAESTEDLWISELYDMLVVGDRLYLTGDLAFYGDERHDENLIALDVRTLAPVGPALSLSMNSGFDRALGLALASDGERLFIGGYFDAINGEARQHLAAIDLANDQLLPWSPNMNCCVSTLALADTTLYVGGYFDYIDEDARGYLAAFDSTTLALQPWYGSVLRYLEVVAVSDTTLLAANYAPLERSGGAYCPALAALDASSGKPTFPCWPITRERDSDGIPFGSSFVQDGLVLDGRLYVTGEFDFVGATKRYRAASFDLANRKLNSWDATANSYGAGYVALAADATTIYAIGTLEVVNGQSRDGVVAIDAQSGDRRVLHELDGYVYDLAFHAGTLYLSYEQYDTERNVLVALDATTGVVRWQHEADDKIVQLLVDGERLLAVGHFSTIAGQARDGLAAFDPANGTLLDWTLPAESGRGVNAITIHDGVLYAAVGGRGWESRQVAAFDSQSGGVLAWQVPVGGPVLNLHVNDTALYTFGYFEGIGEQPIKYAARFSFAAAPDPLTLNERLYLPLVRRSGV